MEANKDFSGLIKKWLLPLVLAFALFLVVRPAMAQTISTPSSVSVGVESVNGFSQVYYQDPEGKKFITSGNINSRLPATAGKFIAYVSDINGENQVLLYNLTGNSKTQLTFSGTNLNPKVDDQGRVVWEGWSESKWQVFLFDGKSVRKLTSGDLSLNPEISGEYISYGRRDVSGTWRAVVYSIKESKSVDVAVGEKARNPKIRNGDIYLAAGSAAEEKFPLSVSDLFLLNLLPLAGQESTSSAVTEADIVSELQASPSGEPEASQSAQSPAQTSE